jgi:hypothetical protein
MAGFMPSEGRTTTTPAVREPRRTLGPVETREARTAFRALQVGFTIAPIVAGIDKFANALTDWERYLAPAIAERFPGGARPLMRLVGGVEIAAGLLVAARPRIGGYVVAAWLAGIVGNLIARRDCYDIALRDVGLSIGAFALARLATQHERAVAGR